ncbi:MAG: TetR/AcrR family transcriptional regulator [Patescibacteria group bacterium]
MILSTKEKIIEESKELFGKKGFRGTSMSDIAEAVGIKKPSLYHFFSNKEEIYFTVLISVMEDVADIFNDAKNSKTSIEVKEVIKKVLKKGLQIGTELVAIKNNIKISDPKLEKEVISAYRKMHKEIKEYLELKEVKDPDFVSQLLLDSQQMYMLRRSCELSRSSVEKYSSQLADLIMSYR